MRLQNAFNNHMAIEDERIRKLVVRNSDFKDTGSGTPLTASELAELDALGIKPSRSVAFKHTEAVKFAREAAAAARGESRRICDAFVISLDPEYTAFRVPLAALSIASQIPEHQYSAWRTTHASSPCAVCGYYRDWSEDPAISANFVLGQGTCGSDSDLVAAVWTLNWFRTVQAPAVETKHLQLFSKLLKIMSDAPPDANATKVAALWSPVLGGNKYSRESFIETLGLAGLLSVPRLPGLLQHWTPWTNRPKTGEMIAPASLWRRHHGINASVFAELFPRCKLPADLRRQEKVG